VYDERAVESVLSGVKRLAAVPWVHSVTDHFASYFDELGISITVSDDAADSDIIALRNDVVALLESAVPERANSFKWLVSFGRRGRTVDVVSRGAGRRSVNEQLRDLGTHAEFDA
jgi:hypothetical protein